MYTCIINVHKCGSHHKCTMIDSVVYYFKSSVFNNKRFNLWIKSFQSWVCLIVLWLLTIFLYHLVLHCQELASRWPYFNTTAHAPHSQPPTHDFFKCNCFHFSLVLIQNSPMLHRAGRNTNFKGFNDKTVSECNDYKMLVFIWSLNLTSFNLVYNNIKI